MKELLKLSNFDFDLPHELIATSPASPRDRARLLVAKNSEEFIDDHFFNLENYFQKGDVLVLNNTKVFPARLFGKREDGKEFEVFLLEENDETKCLVKPGKSIKNDLELSFSENLKGVVSKREEPSKEDSFFIINFNLQGANLKKEIKRIGEMPLPPYILKERGNKHSLEQDETEYQTVFAKTEGSVAAPTAGLHFTDELLEKIKLKGVIVTEVTLHVGLGTFEPIRVNDFSVHKMHSEQFFLSAKTAKILNKAKEEKRRIIACGTTAARVLETVAKETVFKKSSGFTDIFIYPGYKFRAISGLITNFHLPKSSLLLLVSAFYGTNRIKKVYKHAIDNNYTFYSYGDGMLLIKD